MSNERRSIVDDAQLAEVFRSYVDTGVRPFDPAAIAGRAIGDAQRSRWTSLRLAPWHGRRPMLLVALSLLILAAAVAALAGALIQPERGPVPGAIAVWRTTEAGGEIRIFAPDGTLQSILPTSAEDPVAVWSPDGTRIAYVDGHALGPLRVVKADGTDARSITDGYVSSVPAWSPDGRQLAFVGSRENSGAESTSGGLYVVNADGTDLVHVHRPETETSQVAWLRPDVAWAPDGSRIAFVTVPEFDVGDGTTISYGGVIQVVDPRTGELQRVSDAWTWQVNPWVPSWSPDGTRLLYAVAPPEEGGVPLAGGGIAVAQRSPSGWVEELVVPNPYTSEPSWAPMWLGPDRFVFVRDSVMLMVANADGSGERQLARERFMDSIPCVAPDGSMVAVALLDAEGPFPGPRGELLIVDVAGDTPPRYIATGADGGFGGPACSWQALWR